MGFQDVFDDVERLAATMADAALSDVQLLRLAERLTKRSETLERQAAALRMIASAMTIRAQVAVELAMEGVVIGDDD